MTINKNNLTRYLLDDQARARLTPPETVELMARLMGPRLTRQPLFLRSAHPDNQVFAFMYEVLTQDAPVDAFRKAVRAQTSQRMRFDVALTTAVIASDPIWQRPETIALFGKPVRSRIGESSRGAILSMLQTATPTQAIQYISKRYGQVSGTNLLFAPLLDVVEYAGVVTHRHSCKALAADTAERMRLRI